MGAGLHQRGRPALPGGWTRWSFWQYTSSGTVSGIPTSGSTELCLLSCAC